MGGSRLEGLDLARALALVGMVLVNFRLAMGALDGPPGVLAALFTALEGRAAATFVVLAGVGLALATRGLSRGEALGQTWRRSLFLLAVGLVNVCIFPADIVHYYAVYFALAALCLPLATRWLLGLIAALAAGFVALLFVLDYGQGWDWATLSYPAFWTVDGFVRNLLFNGWHPVLPWLAFMLWGLVLARYPLGEARVQRRMVWGGLGVALGAHALAAWAAPRWPDYAGLLGVMPLPPLPLYLLAGGGVATALIGACLGLAARWPAAWRWALPAGRMTLTLYLAHIVVGMGGLEEMGWLSGRSLEQALLAASVYLVLAFVLAWAWSRRFARGPLEALMRRVCDRGGACSSSFSTQRRP